MKEGEENERIDVHVPLQIGVVFNSAKGWPRIGLSSRPLTNRGSL